MRLLERETQLEALDQAATDAAAGRGRTVLVTGEAGIGKTSLVEEFTREIGARTRVLWGLCEALITPRPLGPFYDIVHALGGPLRALLDAEGKQIDLFHALLEAIRKHDGPTVIVLEDVHWADHATLDFIRFLARRIDKAPAVLVLTLRDDEIGADHPLTALVGELPANSRLRLKLPALSRATVEQLAREAGRTQPDLFRITGGNPFFVNEALREDAGNTAASVREAVLSRAVRLSQPARELLDTASVVTDRIELGVLEKALGARLDALDECIDRGFLTLDQGRVAFRHELTRLAIESALPATKRMRLNRGMLELLAKSADDPEILPRLAHHAIAAADADAIIRHVPPAAELATKRGANQEAAALLYQALPHAKRMATKERAEFFEQRAQACFTVNEGKEALAMSEAAYAEWSALNDDLAKGRNLVRRCQIVYTIRALNFGDQRQMARNAVDMIERAGSTDDLALAYAVLALPATIIDAKAAAAHRAKALELLRRTSSAEVRIGVLTWLNTAEFQSLGAPSQESVDALMREARSIGDDHGTLAAYQIGAQRCFRSKDLDGLARCVTDGLAFARDRQLDVFYRGILLERYVGEIALARGDWSAAAANFEAVATRAGTPAWLRLYHLQTPLALLRARQGLPFDHPSLDEAFAREAESHPADRYVLHRVNAEIAWLRADGAEVQRSADVISRIAAAWGHPWAQGEAAFWRRIGGDAGAIDSHTQFAEPYSKLFSGDARGAAEQWQRRGYRYEAGLALMCGDEAAQREALRVFDALGAKATAERVRSHMRDQGISSVPVGPRESTKANPAGLTERETEVLALLAEGLSNADIANRLHRSSRTVEHHVAALIDKLGVASRQAAVAAARQRGFLEK